MDTPVKRYSSGMYLRLGFAIAAHMEADILLVDEVLAVGDAEFQRRCLGKMSEVEQSGRTVLFVSHNMDAMVRLCPESIWLDKGGCGRQGRRSRWWTSTCGLTAADVPQVVYEADTSAPAQIVAISLRDGAGEPTSTITTRTGGGAGDRGGRQRCRPRPRRRVHAQHHVGSRAARRAAERRRGAIARRAGPVPDPLHDPARPATGAVRDRHRPRHALRAHRLAESAVSFAVDGDDLGRTRRLFKLGLPWSVQRLDDHLRPPG